MSPEYVLDGLFSVKSDVFSFRVVVLKIISGKRNNGYYHKQEAFSLISHVRFLKPESCPNISYFLKTNADAFQAWGLWKANTPLDLVDPALA